MDSRRLLATLSLLFLFTSHSVAKDGSQVSDVESITNEILKIPEGKSSKPNAKFKKFLVCSPLFLLPFIAIGCTYYKKSNDKKVKNIIDDKNGDNKTKNMEEIPSGENSNGYKNVNDIIDDKGENDKTKNIEEIPSGENSNEYKSDKAKNPQNLIVRACYSQEMQSNITFSDCHDALKLVKPAKETQFEKTTQLFSYDNSLGLNRTELRRISCALGFLLGQLGIKNSHFHETGKNTEFPIKFSVVTKNNNLDWIEDISARMSKFLFYTEIKCGSDEYVKIQFLVPNNSSSVTCWTTKLFVNNDDLEELRVRFKSFAKEHNAMMGGCLAAGFGIKYLDSFFVPLD